MMRKYHVRFGGGRLEKGREVHFRYLVSRLPYTNAAEIIATLVWIALGRPPALTWVEQYADRAFVGGKPMFREQFDLVQFEWRAAALRRPRWRRIPKCEAEALCRSAL